MSEQIELYRECNHRVLAALIWYEHLLDTGWDEYEADMRATSFLLGCYDAP